jgi:sugar phosphate isomerase/epimerase
MMSAELVASYCTLSGAGVGEPPRHRFAERCRVAAAAGFAGIGMHVDDVQRTVASGTGINEMRSMLSDTGLRLVEIEFVSGWAHGADPSASTGAEDAVYRLADALGGRHVSIGELPPADVPLDLPAAAERLALMGRRASDHGILLALEAFPWSPIGDISTALRLLELADVPNAGLLIDVWHFFNCGDALDDLNGLPAQRIAAVHLNDGPRVHHDFLRNARSTRWLPGDGDLDGVGLVRRLQQVGFTGPYCVEVNYPAFRALPADAAARQAFGKADALVRQARSRVSSPQG